MEDEQRVIKEIRRFREEAVRFHAGTGKPERERWVVLQFLSTLGVAAAEEEMISPQEADPVDVQFRDARFQVKEIYDPTERRQAELKNDLRRAETAINIGDLFGELVARDKQYVDIYPLMVEFAADPRYVTTRVGIDLLFYVTRVDATINLPTEVPAMVKTWRSVSCLFGSRAIILAVQPGAPSFLQH